MDKLDLESLNAIIMNKLIAMQKIRDNDYSNDEHFIKAQEINVRIRQLFPYIEESTFDLFDFASSVLDRHSHFGECYKLLLEHLISSVGWRPAIEILVDKCYRYLEVEVLK